MALLQWVLSIVGAWKPAPPLSPVEIEDLICSGDPLGFFFFFLSSLEAIFSNRSTYYNTFRKHWKQARSLRYIPPSRPLPRLSLFCSIFREKNVVSCLCLLLRSRDPLTASQRDASESVSAIYVLLLWSLVCFNCSSQASVASARNNCTNRCSTYIKKKKKKEIRTVNAEKGICSWAPWRQTKYLMW